MYWVIMSIFHNITANIHLYCMYYYVFCNSVWELDKSALIKSAITLSAQPLLMGL